MQLLNREDNTFAFTMVPKNLSQKGYNISPLATYLFSYLLDRHFLSVANNNHGEWEDENGVYIIFTRDEAMNLIGVGKNKIVELFRELRESALIIEKRQGLNKPNLIYVQCVENKVASEIQQTSGSLENKPQEVGKINPNKTNNKKTNNSFTSKDNQSFIQEYNDEELQDRYNEIIELIEGINKEQEKKDLPQTSPTAEKVVTKSNHINIYNLSLKDNSGNCKGLRSISDKIKDIERKKAVKAQIREVLEEQVNYGELLFRQVENDNLLDALNTETDIFGIELPSGIEPRASGVDLLETIMKVIIDTLCSNKKTVRVSGKEMIISDVKSILNDIRQEHVEQVINGIQCTNTEIKNIRAYIFASMINAIEDRKYCAIY
jgi:hypothetical protein